MIDLRLGDNKIELKSLENDSVDLVVTSPPYDNLRTYDNTMDCWGWDDFTSIASELYRITYYLTYMSYNTTKSIKVPAPLYFVTRRNKYTRDCLDSVISNKCRLLNISL